MGRIFEGKLGGYIMSFDSADISVRYFPGCVRAYFPLHIAKYIRTCYTIVGLSCRLTKNILANLEPLFKLGDYSMSTFIF